MVHCTYSDATIPMQVFSIDHHPKPLAQKLNFGISIAIGLICLCVFLIYMIYTYYIHVYIYYYSAQCYPFSTLNFKLKNMFFMTFHFFPQRFVERHNATMLYFLPSSYATKILARSQLKLLQCL